MKSHSCSGPIGCPAPSFMPSSMSSRVAKPSSNIRTAAIRYGTSSMFTVKLAGERDPLLQLPSLVLVHLPAAHGPLDRRLDAVLRASQRRLARLVHPHPQPGPGRRLGDPGPHEPGADDADLTHFRHGA